MGSQLNPFFIQFYLEELRIFYTSAKCKGMCQV